MTTYRVGGRPRVRRCRVARRPRRVAEAARATGLPVLVVGAGSNMLVADAGSRDRRRAREIDRPHRDRRADRRVVAGAGCCCPCWRADRGGRAHRVRVGGRRARLDRRGGADERRRARLRHGGVADRRHVADLDGRRTTRRRRAGRRARAAVPGQRLAPRTSCSSARLQLAAGDREPPSARSARSCLAPGEPTRRAERRLGVRQPGPRRGRAGRLIDGLGLRGLRIGTASVSEKHANFIQADEGGSADDVRALIEDVRRRVEAATGFSLRSEIRLIGFEDAGDD